MQPGEPSVGTQQPSETSEYRNAAAAQAIEGVFNLKAAARRRAPDQPAEGAAEEEAMSSLRYHLPSASVLSHPLCCSAADGRVNLRSFGRAPIIGRSRAPGEHSQIMPALLVQHLRSFLSSVSQLLSFLSEAEGSLPPSSLRDLGRNPCPPRAVQPEEKYDRDRNCLSATGALSQLTKSICSPSRAWRLEARAGLHARNESAADSVS